MKLICEICDESSVRVVTEAAADGKKCYYIEGVFMQGAVKNKNGRLYPMTVLQPAVDNYKKQYIAENRAYGELGHPAGPTINLERVSHMIRSLEQDGNNFVGRAKLMDTPYGNIARNLLDEGARLGVSSRGMGSLREVKTGIMEVQPDYKLASAADIVADPSAPMAFVKGVMEGHEWLYDESTGHWSVEAVVEQRRSMRRMGIQQLRENALREFSKFLDSTRRGM